MAADTSLLDRLAQRVNAYSFGLRLGECGRVSSVGDGIVWVTGLPSAAAEEILHFEDGSRGMVFELQKGSLGASFCWIRWRQVASGVAGFAYRGEAGNRRG